jgi:hypothetical protein
MDFPVSQNVYAWLLRAYPPAHRAEYGAAMAQLFRDQCRDAWREAGGWGLTKLWFRVLPDWVSTSVRERIAALNERKTMNDKLASLSRDRTTPRAIFIRVAVTVFLLTMILATAVTFILPESYASSCKLLIKYREPTTNNPNLLQEVFQSELQIINSAEVLGSVVEQFNLTDEWSKRYFNGQPLKTSDTVEMLKKRLILSHVSDSHVIALSVYSDDINEPKRITQAIVERYIEASRELHQGIKPEDEMLQNKIKDLRDKLNALDNKMAALRQTFHISKEATEPQSPEEQPYWEAKSNFVKYDQEYKKRCAELEAMRMAKIFTPGAISDISVFDPPTSVYPTKNKPKTIFYGAAFGIFLGLLAGAAAALVAAKLGNRAPKNAPSA